MKKRKNIFISVITCFASICLMMFGVYASANPSVSINGQVSYSVHDAKVLVQGKINGAKGQQVANYKQPNDINNLSASDKVSSSTQFLSFTTGAGFGDSSDDLDTWDFGQLEFYEDKDGIKSIDIAIKVTNFSKYPVKATLNLADTNVYTNISATTSKTEVYLSKYDMDNTLASCDDFLITFKVVDDSKNASANNLNVNIVFEKYVDQNPTLDKLTITYNKTLYETYKSYESYGVVSQTSPLGKTDYYVAEINQNASGEVVIPATYDDGTHGILPVVPARTSGILTVLGAIGSGKDTDEALTLAAIAGVTKLTLCTGIDEVQNVAFAVMPSMTSVNIPSSLKYFQSATFAVTGLTSIALPYGTSALPTFELNGKVMGMFYLCQSLESVTIPEAVTVLDKNLFGGCSNLSNVIITNGVTQISDYAFEDCSSLASIVLPSDLESIGSSAFAGCTNLTSINIPSTVTSIGRSTFFRCSSLNSIIIPEGITSIVPSMFNTCTNLTSITIPESVTSIGSGAFSGCSSLASIVLPSGILSIGSGAFESCTSLTQITLPKGLEGLANYAFKGCTNLTSITIPESVTSMGSGVFGDCDNLTNVKFEGENPPATMHTTFSNCTIYVPSASVDIYTKAWKGSIISTTCTIVGF